MDTNTYRPLTPGTRFRSRANVSQLSKKKPERKLVETKNRINGRNSDGRITLRRRGGGHKRKYRLVDFRRDKLGIPGVITAIEYDPNRSARLALVTYADGDKRYIICPNGVSVGQAIQSGKASDVKPGNCLPLKDIPVGEFIHNIELRPGEGGKLARSAGTQVQLMAKTEKFALLRLPSGEQRQVLLTCTATIGIVGNADHANRSYGKAGVTRWKGRRPKVRGVAMNPVDHPMGGGEGKTSGGRHPVSPWGWKTKGKKTRKNKRTDKFIVRRRTK